MAQRISMIDGVAQVFVYGAQKFAVRVQLDPSLMAARNIGIDDVEIALGAHNVNMPTGTLWGATAGLHRSGHRAARYRRRSTGP